MGLAAGPDVYQFALGRPHSFIDPLGLQSTTSGLIVIIQTLLQLNTDTKNAKCDADLTAAAKRLAAGFVTKYLDAMDSFQSASLSGVKLSNTQIATKEMQLAIPSSTTAAQWAQIKGYCLR